MFCYLWKQGYLYMIDNQFASIVHRTIPVDRGKGSWPILKGVSKWIRIPFWKGSSPTLKWGRVPLMGPLMINFKMGQIPRQKVYCKKGSITIDSNTLKLLRLLLKSTTHWMQTATNPIFQLQRQTWPTCREMFDGRPTGALARFGSARLLAVFLIFCTISWRMARRVWPCSYPTNSGCWRCIYT